MLHPNQQLIFKAKNFLFEVGKNNALETFFSHWVALSSNNFTLSYWILFCPIWLSFLGGLLFSEEEMELKRIWGRGDVGYELGGVEGANCGWYV